MRFAPTRLFVAEAGCLWPFRADVQPPPEPENKKMREGKAVHAIIEAAVLHDTMPQAPVGQRAIEWLRERPSGARIPEAVLGIELPTGRVEPFKTRSDVPADWMPAIVDLAIVADTLEVWDWKTGSPFSTFDYRPQVRANAYAVATHLGRDEAIAGLAYVSPEGVRAKDWTLDEFDFADQRRKLRMWAAAAPEAKPTPCDACRYCHARKICPTQMDAPKRAAHGTSSW